MDVGEIFLFTLFGAVSLITMVCEALMWPLSKTMCRKGQKMTIPHGCADPGVPTVGQGGMLAVVVSCVLSLVAVCLMVGPIEGSMLSAFCCLLSFLTCIWNMRHGER